MNPKPLPVETPPAPPPSHDLPNSPSLEKSEVHRMDKEARERSDVPPAFKQLHELQRLQSERIEQLFKLLVQDRNETLATVREMAATMELAQEMLARQDQIIANLGEAVAALVRFAPMIQQLIAALQEA